MKNLTAKSIIGFIISLVSVLGINFIPLEMWLYRDFSGENTMVLYALETLVAVFLAVIFVLLFAPQSQQTEKLQTRKELLQGYMVAALGLSAGSGIFLCAFIFLILKTKIALAAVISALIWIFGFQLLEFIADAIMLRPLSLAKAGIFLNRSLGRVALLFLGVFLGIFAAAFVDKWFVVPFVILKTIVDIGEQIQIFTRFREKGEDVNPPTQNY